MLFEAPEQVRQIKEMGILYDMTDTIGQELMSDMERLKQNQFLSTATKESIEAYEKMLGITKDENDTLESRRFRVQSKVLSSYIYTYKSVVKKIEMLGGNLIVDYEKQEVSCILKEISIEMIRVIREYMDHAIPLNVLINILQYIDTKLKQVVEYDFSLELVSSFYPRYNLETRTLNGSWLLRENCLLNGYKTDKIIDFYPTNIEINGGIKNDVLIDNKIEISSMAKETIKTTSEVQILSRTENEIQVENNMILQGDSKQKIEYDTNLVIEKDLWHLDGTMCLDGSRLLDAEIQKFVL